MSDPAAQRHDLVPADDTAPQPRRHTPAGDLTMAAVLVTAAHFARAHPAQPFEAASPDEVAFLADHVKPMVDCLRRDFSPEQIQATITALCAATQTAIEHGLGDADWVALMDRIGTLRQTLRCLASRAEEANRVAYRLYVDHVDRPLDAAGGGAQGGEAPPAAPSS